MLNFLTASNFNGTLLIELFQKCDCNVIVYIKNIHKRRFNVLRQPLDTFFDVFQCTFFKP